MGEGKVETKRSVNRDIEITMDVPHERRPPHRLVVPRILSICRLRHVGACSYEL